MKKKPKENNAECMTCRYVIWIHIFDIYCCYRCYWFFFSFYSFFFFFIRLDNAPHSYFSGSYETRTLVIFACILFYYSLHISIFMCVILNSSTFESKELKTVFFSGVKAKILRVWIFMHESDYNNFFLLFFGLKSMAMIIEMVIIRVTARRRRFVFLCACTTRNICSSVFFFSFSRLKLICLCKIW